MSGYEKSSAVSSLGKIDASHIEEVSDEENEYCVTPKKLCSVFNLNFRLFNSVLNNKPQSVAMTSVTNLTRFDFNLLLHRLHIHHTLHIASALHL